jgi:hypothetical protein
MNHSPINRSSYPCRPDFSETSLWKIQTLQLSCCRMIRTANCVPFILSMSKTDIAHVNNAYARNNLMISMLMEHTQDWQWTYKRKYKTHLLKHFVVGGNKYNILCVCVCRLRYPAYIAHVPNYHLWPFWFYNTFSILSQKGTIFRKELKVHPCTGIEALYRP